MHFLTPATIALLALTTTISSAPTTDLIAKPAVVLSDLPFTFEYLFTAQLNLGSPAKPITIPGGMRVVEPIINGTVSGPAINATIQYSLATPKVINEGSTQVPTINAVGITDDGEPVYLYEQGIGSPNSQVSRIVSVLHVEPRCCILEHC